MENDYLDDKPCYDDYFYEIDEYNEAYDEFKSLLYKKVDTYNLDTLFIFEKNKNK